MPGLPQFFPEANPLDLLPNAMFNGNAMPGTIGVFQYERRVPFYGYNTLWNVSASLTRVARAHNIKTGVFVEDFTRPGRQRSSFNGTINFSADGSNPLNTNVGFANALLGAITSYQKADVRTRIRRSKSRPVSALPGTSQATAGPRFAAVPALSTIATTTTTCWSSSRSRRSYGPTPRTTRRSPSS